MALRGYDTGSTSEPGLSNRNRRVLNQVVPFADANDLR